MEQWELGGVAHVGAECDTDSPGSKVEVVPWKCTQALHVQCSREDDVLVGVGECKVSREWRVLSDS